IDPKFFEAFLLADHSKVPRPAKPAVAQAPVAAPAAAVAAAAAPAGEPLRLSLVTANNQTRFAPGEAFSLVVRPSDDAHVYCSLATKRDVATALPGTMLGTDFEPLVVASIDQIRNAFAAATGGAVAEETFHVQAK